MGLHDRLQRQNGTTNGQAPDALDALAGQQPETPEKRPGPVRRAQDPHPPRLHRQARPAALLGRQGRRRHADEDIAEQVLRAVTEQLALDRTPLTREERRQVIREITDDILGYGPLEPLLRDDSVTEVMVNDHDRVYVERKGKIERVRRDVRRQRPPAADHRQDRLAGRPPRRRGLADGRRAPPRRQPCERDHPAALAARADADDPEVLARPVHDGRPDQRSARSRRRRRSSSPPAFAGSSTSSSPAVPAPVRRRR